mmetsp:Transcript_16647/g.63317  ORF Transcript_16647/g.63317 Transcript_16647/m.63317 type:complete len:102 (-) Transcript_16647:1077-1382(-)
MIALGVILMVLGRVGGHVGPSRVGQAMSFLQSASPDLSTAPKVAFGAAKAAAQRLFLDAGVPEAEASARFDLRGAGVSRAPYLHRSATYGNIGSGFCVETP